MESSIIFQSYGLFYGTLDKSEITPGRYTFLSYSPESDISKVWRYSVRKKLPFSIKSKVDAGALTGYFLVYPHFKIKEKRKEPTLKQKVFDLGFQIYKYSTVSNPHLSHGEFIAQGAITSSSYDKFKLGIGRNDEPWREYRPYQIMVSGNLNGRVGELWHCRLQLNRYKFELKRAQKLSNVSPTIRFN